MDNINTHTDTDSRPTTPIQEVKAMKCPPAPKKAKTSSNYLTNNTDNELIDTLTGFCSITINNCIQDVFTNMIEKLIKYVNQKQYPNENIKIKKQVNDNGFNFDFVIYSVIDKENIEQDDIDGHNDNNYLEIEVIDFDDYDRLLDPMFKVFECLGNGDTLENYRFNVLGNGWNTSDLINDFINHSNPIISYSARQAYNELCSLNGDIVDELATYFVRGPGVKYEITNKLWEAWEQNNYLLQEELTNKFAEMFFDCIIEDMGTHLDGTNAYDFDSYTLNIAFSNYFSIENRNNAIRDLKHIWKTNYKDIMRQFKFNVVPLKLNK